MATTLESISYRKNAFADIEKISSFFYLWSQATVTPTAVCGQSRYWFSSQHSFMVCSVWSHDTEAEEITLDIYKNKERCQLLGGQRVKINFLKKKTQFKVLSLNTLDVRMNIYASFPVSCLVLIVTLADIVTTLNTRSASQEKKVNKPPSLPPYYCSLINDRLYELIITVKLRVDWSRMVYSPTGSSDLFLILGCMTNFLY